MAGVFLAMQGVAADQSADYRRSTAMMRRFLLRARACRGPSAAIVP